MLRSDAFICSNLLAADSTTTMQAISAGLPVICMRRGWASDAIDSSCGLPVPPNGCLDVQRAFAGAIQRLLTEDGLLRRLSEGAAVRALELSWDANADLVSDWYARILGQRPLAQRA
jgi:glycosyltransferase involved in cell wall biosynthesis